MGITSTTDGAGITTVTVDFPPVNALPSAAWFELADTIVAQATAGNRSVEEITRAPKHPYTVGLMGSIPPLRARVPRLTQIDGVRPRPDAIPVGCPFNARCDKAGPRCRRELPPLVDVTGTKAACWLYSGGVN